MSRIGRRATLGAAAVAGVLAGVAASLAWAGPDGTGATSSTASPSTASPATASPVTAVATADPADVLLVWTSGGLPDGLAHVVRTVPGVEQVTLVRGDETGMVRSRDRDGSVVDAQTDGWRIPLDTLAVEPSTFASFLSGADAATVGTLEPGEALLTTTSAELRRLGKGSTIELDGGAVTVVGTIGDLSGAGAELLVSGGDAAPLGVTTERYLLVRHTTPRAVLELAIADELGGRAVRFRTPAETTWLRHGDAVEPNLVVKAALGEFAYRNTSGRSVEISPEWVARWIVTERVPILGEVTCHRTIMQPLRAALEELSDGALGHLVDPSDFAGCFSARRIAAGQPLSHHAWGAALDLNVDGNPRGSFSTQDQRLVDTMARHGFTWGGAWLVPDPAHYEAPLPTTAGLVSGGGARPGR